MGSGSTIKACQCMYSLVDIDKLVRLRLQLKLCNLGVVYWCLPAFTVISIISVESLPGNIPVSASVAFVATLGVGLVRQVVSAG